jgi:hypothetical protein
MAGGSSNLDHVRDRASQQIGLIRAGKFQRLTWSRLRAGAPETNDARRIITILPVGAAGKFASMVMALAERGAVLVGRHQARLKSDFRLKSTIYGFAFWLEYHEPILSHGRARWI